MNPLLELCNPIFALTSVFYSGDRGADLTENHQHKLTAAITDLEHNAYAKQMPSLEIQYIKYAMVAFIDEAVLNSAWPFCANWMGNPLQLQHFGEHTAGEKFFTRLNELRQAGSQYIDILEIYYICLQLGFEGMYHLRGSEKLMPLQRDLYNQIATARGSVNPCLAPQGLPQQNIVTKIRKKLPFWVILSATGALLFCIYLGYSLAINHKAKTALQNIYEKYHEQKNNY